MWSINPYKKTPFTLDESNQVNLIFRKHAQPTLLIRLQATPHRG